MPSEEQQSHRYLSYRCSQLIRVTPKDWCRSEKPQSCSLPNSCFPSDAALSPVSACVRGSRNVGRDRAAPCPRAEGAMLLPCGNWQPRTSNLASLGGRAGAFCHPQHPHLCLVWPSAPREGEKGVLGRRWVRLLSQPPGSGGAAIPRDKEWGEPRFLRLAGTLELYFADNKQPALSLLAGRLIL